MAAMTRYLTAAFAAAIAILLSFHHVLGWNLRLSVLDSTWPSLMQDRGNQEVFQEPTAPIPAPQNSTPAWNVIEHLGGHGPWFQKTQGTVTDDLSPPEGCRVDQVHMISRHAERYPTTSAGASMLDFLSRMVKANVSMKGNLAFLNDWEFFADQPADAFESLVSTGPYAGTLEAFTTGVKLRTRYADLLADALNRKATSFWASDSRRVIDTARYFGAGFFGIDWERLTKLVIISEGPENGADTLTPGRTCLNYRYNDGEFGRELGHERLAKFLKSYEGDIVARLAEQNPDLPFAEDDVFTMQMMCGFETIARGSSPWCDVFTPKEMEKFEYARDLLHYYRAGPGNKYAGAMGWLWLNATSNLLQEGPSAGPLFLSFVHDGDIIPLIHTLNLLPQHPPLPTSHNPSNRTWRTSDIVPMGGRLIFERLACHVPETCWATSPLYPNHVFCTEAHEEFFVRLNVNDGVAALPGCDGGPGGSCPLGEFKERVRARGEVFGRFGEVCGLEDGASERITFLHQ